MDKNKKRNDMEEKVIDLIWDVKEGKIHPNTAYKELCVLFNVVGQSEQLVCESCTVKLDEFKDGRLFCQSCLKIYKAN